MKEPNRTRRVQLNIRLTEAELDLVRQKMALIKVSNFSSYARKMLIDGYIIEVDYSFLKAHAQEIQKVGVNINQIAHRMNALGGVFVGDADEIKRFMHEVILLERKVFSSAHRDMNRGQAGD
jgi:SepF-like predicted cell division protein (DUF552 family)